MSASTSASDFAPPSTNVVEGSVADLTEFDLCSDGVDGIPKARKREIGERRAYGGRQHLASHPRKKQPAQGFRAGEVDDR